MRLFRAVRRAELEDVRLKSTFRNPEGIEVKYFSPNEIDARRYGILAAAAFGDGPYFLVSAEVPDRFVTAEMIVVVDAAMSAYVVQTSFLENISDLVEVGVI